MSLRSDLERLAVESDGNINVFFSVGVEEGFLDVQCQVMSKRSHNLSSAGEVLRGEELQKEQHIVTKDVPFSGPKSRRSQPGISLSTG